MTRHVLTGALRRFVAPWLLAAMLCAPASFAVAADEDVDAGGKVAATALVQIDGRTILRVRGSAGLPAAERARVIEERIIKLARNPAIPPEAVTLQDTQRGTVVKAGDVLLLTVTEGDAALEEMDRNAVALATQNAVQQAVKSWRFERSTERRLRNLYWTIGATLGTALVLWLLGRIFRRLRRFF